MVFMKKLFLLIALSLSLASCGVVSATGSVVGGTIDELEKGKKWKFRAVLNEENVAACKIKDAYITVE